MSDTKGEQCGATQRMVGLARCQEFLDGLAMFGGETYDSALALLDHCFSQFGMS